MESSGVLATASTLLANTKKTNWTLKVNAASMGLNFGQLILPRNLLALLK
jgi:hypothetical protein